MSDWKTFPVIRITGAWLGKRSYGAQFSPVPSHCGRAKQAAAKSEGNHGGYVALARRLAPNPTEPVNEERSQPGHCSGTRSWFSFENAFSMAGPWLSLGTLPNVLHHVLYGQTLTTIVRRLSALQLKRKRLNAGIR